nr:hypothetical protein [Tanacetum cinerariifolium]
MLPWNILGGGTSRKMMTMFAKKDFKHTFKHQKEKLTFVKLGSHLCIEESLRVQDSDKPRSNNVAGPSVVNMVEHNNSSRLGHVHYKRMQDMSEDRLIPAFDIDTEKWNKKYFVTFIDDASGFCYVHLLHTKDEALDKNDMLIFGTDQVYVYLTKEFLSSRFSMKDTGEVDVILVSTPMDTSEKLMPNNGQAVSQLEYYRVIGCVMYAMTCTRLDIMFAVGKKDTLMQARSAILKTIRLLVAEYSLLGRGAISWAFKKQTCITSLTMDSEFVALAAAGKEAEWLRNLFLKISFWSKPIAHISILCDSAATLAKAYSQMYNGKARHLGVRHSMIRKLIMNGVVTEHLDSNSGKREFKSMMKFISRRTPSRSNPSDDSSLVG